MTSTRVIVHARAALLGNPSDGFGGRTLAVELRNFAAQVRARPAGAVRLASGNEAVEFSNPDELVAAGRAGRYPPAGPLALLIAAAKRFCELAPVKGGFELVARSDIPPRVGLAGSSAIVVGALRALAGAHGTDLDSARLAELALRCETEELGIAAGMQDRVVQAIGGLVAMDFDPALVQRQGHGSYEPLDPALLPPLFIAYLPRAATDSGAAHAGARRRFAAGDPELTRTMAEIAALVPAGRAAIESGDLDELGRLMDLNLDLRARVYDLDPRHVAMVGAARGAGAAVNYTGSGGAIVGPHDGSDAGLQRLRAALEPLGCVVQRARVGAI